MPASRFRRPTQDSVRLKAYAKVNLCLSVGPPIADGPKKGMHPIASWMAAVDLTDEVRLDRIDAMVAPDPHGPDPTRWSIRWADGRPVSWPETEDLGRRAHRLFDDLNPTSLTKGRIRKSIPAGGGLGGGSSDAAAVMMGMNGLYALGLSVEELQRRSAALGSDIAFFIHDGEPGTPPPPALVSGLGDEIVRTPALEGAVTLICPPFGCPTGEVYRAFDETHDGAAVRTDAVASAAHAARPDNAVLFNDLADAACRVRPELAQVRERAQQATGRPVHVSGSGSTLFVLGEVEPGTIEAMCPEERVVRTRFV